MLFTLNLSSHLIVKTNNLDQMNDDQVENRDYKNFNTDAFKRDIDEIDWSLATGSVDVNLDFELFLMRGLHCQIYSAFSLTSSLPTQK